MITTIDGYIYQNANFGTHMTSPETYALEVRKNKKTKKKPAKI